MGKNILLLIVLATRPVLAMEEKLQVQVPPFENRNSDAQNILSHVGYPTADVHLKAILYAFEKMAIKPTLVRPDIERGEDSHKVLTPFDHAKLHWYYYTHKKTQELIPAASTSKVIVAGKEPAQPNPVNNDAQQLVTAALEYYFNCMDYHATIKITVGLAVGTLGLLGTVLAPLLMDYFKASCAEHSGS